MDLDTLTVESPVAPKSATQAAATPTDDKPIQLDIIPSGSESGLPLIPTTDVKQLEQLANEGDVVNLTKTVLDLAQNQQTKSDKVAVKKAGKELLKQLYAKQRAALASRVTQPQGIAPPVPAELVSQPAAPPAAAPEPLTPTPAPTHEKPIQLDTIPTMGEKSAPLITMTNVKKLEKLANQGEAEKLTKAVKDLALAQKDESKQFAIKKAGKELLEKLYAKQGNPQTVDLDSLTKPTLSEYAAKPGWVQVGPQAGSTPGGLYEDSQGVKHYIKCPPTQDHVNNELLAFDLYKAVGLKVPEAHLDVMDGKWCMASKVIDGLSKGGTNPKDLKGAKEGFVADAWLANWDAVGVGATKYDNYPGFGRRRLPDRRRRCAALHRVRGPKAR